MKTKLKNNNIIKSARVIVIFSIALAIIAFLLISKSYTNKTYAVDVAVEEENIKTYMINENIEELNLEEIIKQNTLNTYKEEYIVQEIDLEFRTRYQNDSSLPKGTIQVTQEGIDGKQKVIVKKVYAGEEVISENVQNSIVTKAATNKVVSVGTGSGTVSKTTAKVGDILYVTSESLAMRIEADKTAQKINTLSKNMQVKLIEKEDLWYKVSYQNYVGWVNSECLTNMEPYVEQNKQENNTSTSDNTSGISKLSFNMALNKKSGLSLEQFKKILSNDSNDKNNVFAKTAEYFYYAEQQYNVNGVFIAAVGIHESAWGTSNISLSKKNLFGYGAYDSDPSGGAYSFTNYSEGIDLIARVFAKYYLNPKGTKIYDGQTASGAHYNGSTISAVNTKYASDKSWANKVYNWMEYLYNKL